MCVQRVLLKSLSKSLRAAKMIKAVTRKIMETGKNLKKMKMIKILLSGDIITQ